MMEEKKLAWWDEFETERNAGRHAFLFVGAVGDGFPHDNPTKDDPVDTLDTWEDLMVRRLGDYGKDKNLVLWTFDLVRGFRFPYPEHEKKFRDLLTPPDDRAVKGREDPLAKAKQKMAEQEPLPGDPASAIPLMLSVFELAQRVGSDKKKPATRCVAILPALDSLCGATAAGADKSGTRVALALVQFASGEAYRRGGHLIVASSPTVRALDERLRRPDAPFVAITIRKPDAKRRQSYLTGLCGDGGLSNLQEMLRGMQVEIDTERRSQRDSAYGSVSSLTAQLQEHVGMRESDIRDDADVLAAKHEHDNLQTEYHRQCAEAKKRNLDHINRLKQEREDLEKRLCSDVTLIEGPLDKAAWERINVGDHIQVFEKAGMVRDLVVQKTVFHHAQSPIGTLFGGNCYGINLASRVDNNLVALAVKTGRAHEFLIVQNVLCIVNTSGVSEPFVPGATVKHSPAARLVAIERTRSIDNQLARMVNDAPNVIGVRMQMDTAFKRMLELQTEASKRWGSLKKLLEERLAEAKNIASGTVDSPHIQEVQKRIVVLAEQQKAYAERGYYPVPEMGVAELARLTQGFGYRDMVHLLRAAQAVDKPVQNAEVTGVRMEILQRAYGHLIEVVEPAYGFEGIAGLDGIKSFLYGVRDAIRQGDSRNVPMGCLLMGPPGTGKTAVAEGFASECGFLFVKVRNVRSMWVGETERQMEELGYALRDLAPVVVLRDEVDEEDSGRDSFQGDSGVSSRARRMWMTLLSDPLIRGKIFVMSCTNRPDRLDPALKRSGRTDERIPVLMPDDATRYALFRVMIKRGNFPSRVDDFSDFVEATRGLSGADVEVIVRHAYEFACRAGKDAIEVDALHAAINDFVPSASQKDIARMTLFALAETSGRRFMPPDAEKIVRECKILAGEQPGLDALLNMLLGGIVVAPDKPPTAPQTPPVSGDVN